MLFVVVVVVVVVVVCCLLFVVRCGFNVTLFDNRSATHACHYRIFSLMHQELNDADNPEAVSSGGPQDP